MEFQFCKLCIKSFSSPVRLHYIEPRRLTAVAALKSRKKSNSFIKEEWILHECFPFMKVQQNFPLCHATLALDTLFTCVIINSKRNIKHPWLFLLFFLALFVNGKFIFMTLFRKLGKISALFSFVIKILWMLMRRSQVSWSVTQLL